MSAVLRNLEDLVRDPVARAIGLAFALNAVLFASWYTRIADVQVALGLSDAMLGLVMLGLPAGSIAALPLASMIIGAVGEGRSTLIAGFACCVALLLPMFAAGPVSLFMILVVMGLGNGAMDVSMNAAASSHERRSGRSIMTTFHAMFSVGGIVGALIGTVAIMAGLPPGGHLALAALGSAVVLVLCLAGWRRFEPAVRLGPVFALPSRPLMVLAGMAFLIFMGESVVADWSAVFIANHLGGAAVLAPMGFMMFSAGMMVGRIFGDAAIDRFGALSIMRFGALTAFAGLMLAALPASVPMAIIGFGITGLGLSALVPILFGMAGRMPGLSSGTSIAAVASVGYSGWLAGPPLVGAISEAFGLAMALVLIAIGLCVVAATSGFIRGRSVEPRIE